MGLAAPGGMDPREALMAFGRAADAQGLLASTCGNASVRLDDARFVVSASGSALRSLGPGDLSLVSLHDGVHLDGPKPSMECELHRRAYLTRPRVGAVLHAQSRAATVLACAADPPDNLDLIPEIPAYVRRFATVPYAMPGSAELAESVEVALRDPDVTVVQMVNHGQVVVGAKWSTVIRRATFFELAAWMVLQGLPLRRIPAEDAARLRDYSRDA